MLFFPEPGEEGKSQDTKDISADAVEPQAIIVTWVFAIQRQESKERNAEGLAHFHKEILDREEHTFPVFSGNDRIFLRYLREDGVGQDAQ